MYIVLFKTYKLGCIKSFVCFSKRLSTFSTVVAIVFAFAYSADHDRPAHP